MFTPSPSRTLCFLSDLGLANFLENFNGSWGCQEMFHRALIPSSAKQEGTDPSCSSPCQV